MYNLIRNDTRNYLFKYKNKVMQIIIHYNYYYSTLSVAANGTFPIFRHGQRFELAAVLPIITVDTMCCIMNRRTDNSDYRLWLLHSL